jgi:hypothetical protein
MKNYLKYLLAGACKKTVLLVALVFVSGLTWNTCAQETKPRIKLGAYYFGGWAGKNRSDDGTPENAWAKGMPTSVRKKLVTEFAGRMPVWGWRDDTQEIMERQIDLAADNGLAYFSFCWYWADNKGPINAEKIEGDSKHLGMRLFMQAKNNNRMEFSLLVANHSGAEIIGVDAWKQAADYWIKNYFKHPRYLRMDGKPVIVIFETSGGNAEGYAYLQEAARKAGFPGVEIAGSTGLDIAGNTLKDGYTLRANYGIVPGWGKEPEMHQYSEIIEMSMQKWHGSPQQPYIPSITVGCDPRPWGTKAWHFEGNTPEAFGNFLKILVKWMDEHPEQITRDRLAVTYAWNEIGEGAILVPTKDDPDGAYLKAIRRVVLGK